MLQLQLFAWSGELENLYTSAPLLNLVVIYSFDRYQGILDRLSGLNTLLLGVNRESLVLVFRQEKFYQFNTKDT